MIICEKCMHENSDNQSRCDNCGLLIGVPIREQKIKFLERLENDNFISIKDWSLLLTLLLIPGYNIYIIVKIGFISKKESTINNFFKGFLLNLVGVFVVIQTANYFFNN